MKLTHSLFDKSAQFFELSGQAKTPVKRIPSLRIKIDKEEAKETINALCDSDLAQVIDGVGDTMYTLSQRLIHKAVQENAAIPEGFEYPIPETTHDTAEYIFNLCSGLYELSNGWKRNASIQVCLTALYGIAENNGFATHLDDILDEIAESNLSKFPTDSELADTLKLHADQGPTPTPVPGTNMWVVTDQNGKVLKNAHYTPFNAEKWALIAKQEEAA